MLNINRQIAYNLSPYFLIFIKDDITEFKKLYLRITAISWLN